MKNNLMLIICFLSSSLTCTSLAYADASFSCKAINDLFSEGSYAPKPNVTIDYQVMVIDQNQATVSKTVLPSNQVQTTSLRTTRFNPTVYSSDQYAFKKLSETQSILRTFESGVATADYLCAKVR